jgi:hypothetical protein
MLKKPNGTTYKTNEAAIKARIDKNIFWIPRIVAFRLTPSKILCPKPFSNSMDKAMMNQAQKIRSMMNQAQSIRLASSIEKRDFSFEIELLGTMYRSDQFTGDISPLTRLLYKERRNIQSLEQSLASQKQTHEMVEQQILEALKT